MGQVDGYENHEVSLRASLADERLGLPLRAMTLSSRVLLPRGFLRCRFALPFRLCRCCCNRRFGLFRKVFGIRLRQKGAILCLPFAVRWRLLPGSYLPHQLAAALRGCSSRERLGRRDAMLHAVRSGIKPVSPEMATGQLLKGVAAFQAGDRLCGDALAPAHLGCSGRGCCQGVCGWSLG